MIYLHLGILLYATYTLDTFAMGVLATLSALLATFFYWMCFELVAGLKHSRLNIEYSLNEALVHRFIFGTTLLALYQTGDPLYVLISAYGIPWIIIGLATDILAIMVRRKVILILPKEKE